MRSGRHPRRLHGRRVVGDRGVGRGCCGGHRRAGGVETAVGKLRCRRPAEKLGKTYGSRFALYAGVCCPQFPRAHARPAPDVGLKATRPRGCGGTSCCKGYQGQLHHLSPTCSTSLWRRHCVTTSAGESRPSSTRVRETYAFVIWMPARLVARSDMSRQLFWAKRNNTVRGMTT